MRIFGRIACCSLLLLLVPARGADLEENYDATTEAVGRGTNGFETPVNQHLTPAGTLVELPGIRPKALALSPDGELLVTAGTTNELVVVNPTTGNISQRVPFPSDQAQEQTPVSAEILSPAKKPQLSFTGLAFSPDGSRIYLANVNGDLKVFGVSQDKKVSPLFSIALPAVTGLSSTNEIPAGIAVSRNGKKIYVALNLSNRLAEMDAVTGIFCGRGARASRRSTWFSAKIKFTSAIGAVVVPTRTV